MGTSPHPVIPDTLKEAQEYARSMKVHRRQCVLLCALVEKAFTAGSPVQSNPEAGQQWDDALTIIHEHLSDWCKLDIVHSFLKSDQIRLGIDQLFGELRWCGMRPEDLNLTEKRRQDEDLLQDTLRTIVSNIELLKRTLNQPLDRIQFFVGKLQTALINGINTDSVRSKLDSALMFLYKNASVGLPTPDLTAQIVDIDSMPYASDALCRAHHANWLGQERVEVKVLRLVQYNPTSADRFRREVSEFYSVRHQNIVRVYGIVLNEFLGCCVVTPSMNKANALACLGNYGDIQVLPWLKDIAIALQYLHALTPPIICGCLRAENILIKDDGQRACIADFGLFPLSGQMPDNVQNLLRWCAPELIRAAKRREQVGDMISICNCKTDIYSFGIVMFEASITFPDPLFTGAIPFCHIEDNETLEPEIIHGTRPIMSDGLKTTATCRGFSAGTSALMKACWSPEPRKRPNSDVLVREIISCLDLEARPELRKAAHRPESSSSNSVMSTKSVSTSSSSQSSISHPLTPRSNESLRAGSQVTILATQADVSGSSGQIFSSSSQIFSEPASVELDHKITERQESVEVLRKTSGHSIHSHKNVSEQTIHQESRLSFSSDGEEGHLGQRDNSAYERMPKLMSSLSLSKRRDSKDRFEILVSRMTVDGQVNPNWVGVASMEGLRGITRSSSKLTQVSAVESLVKREAQFLADTTDEYVTHRLRSDPGILGVDRLEGFLSNVFEESHALRMCNHHFSNALQMYSNISTIGFTKMALLCKEAGEEFCLHYPEYVRCLPEIEACIMGEIESNGRFAGLMEEMQHNGNTLRQVLENFLRAPVTHLDQHPRTLQLIISGMAVGDPEIPALQSSYEVMLKAVNLVHLSSWQQSADSKGWKDFVSTEIVKGASKMDVSRQTSIFILIAEERNYVARLKILQEILQNTHSELVNLQRKEDAALQDIVKSLIAIFSDFLRFHRRLLENLFTLQRSEHPFIGKFVTTCGADRIPWHSLYDIRFGTSYRKLANMMQEDKVRSGIFKRVMQQEPSLTKEVDFMSFLRLPNSHLRAFVGYLRAISELTPEGNDDRQVISDIFPRLWDVSQQVELKTSISKERARLSSLAAALDFSDHPGVENDVDIASSSRILIMSGNLRLGMSNPRSRKFHLEERFVVLLDNYLLFTSKTDSQGILRLNVCERPVPLELITVSFNDIPPTNVPKFLHLCLKLHYSGQEIYLYAEKEHTPRVWQNKLQETLKTRAAESERTRVIDMELVHRFAKAPACSAEFNLAGQDILVIACEAPTPGIWIRQGHNSGLRHVVALSGITSILVLDDLGILMVLSEKSLLWYRLDDIMKGNRVTDRRLDESMSVYFYRTGCFGSRTFLVVSARKKGRNVLRFFEAAENGKSSKVMNTFKNKAGPFRLVTEVDLSYHVKDIYFLKSSFILVTDTFQLVNFSDAQHLKEDLTSTKRQVLPLPDDPLTDLAERCRSSIPIAINRFDKDFILCYQDFAAYINVNGQLSTKIVEWESKDVRNILFRPPYILILGTSTLEIRQIASGKLEQLMAAPSRIQLSWERRCDEDSQGNFGIHLILDASQDFGPSNQWYTLAADGHGDPYTLFRLSDRLWGR